MGLMGTVVLCGTDPAIDDCAEGRDMEGRDIVIR